MLFFKFFDLLKRLMDGTDDTDDTDNTDGTDDTDQYLISISSPMVPTTRIALPMTIMSPMTTMTVRACQ